MYQLLFIVHTWYKAFDGYPTLENITEAFDKVWHEGLIYKLKSLGVSDSLLKRIRAI